MTPRTSRRRLLAGVAGVGAASLAGCLGSGDDEVPAAAASGDETGTATATTEPAPTEPPSETPSETSTEADPAAAGLPTADARLPVRYDFETLRDRTRSGGPPKDGIPSVDEPNFVTVAEAERWLVREDIVFGLVAGDEVKAYPQKVLVWHEICNDVVDGTPLSVTYCPLTGTALGFERGETTFGVSGNLVNSNLVMYDRATDSRWPQVLATAVEGPFRGASLREVPLVWTTWERWTAAHPDTLVLSTDTGYARDYSRDPYGSYTPPSGYYTSDRTLFAPLTEDDRLGRKDVVVGVRTADGVAAFSKESLRERGLLTGDVGDVPYLLAYDGALDAGYAYRNPEGAAFEAVADGVRGPDGTVHAASALPLARTMAFDAMWFAFAGFYPGTALYE